MTDLATLTAYADIQRAKARYCRTIDTKDWVGFGDIMTDDIRLDVSEGTGLEPIIGRDNAVNFIRQSVDSAQTAHQVHYPEIDLHGDEATAVWAMHDRIIFDNGVKLSGYGQYHERWVRTERGWRIAELKLTRLILEFTQPGVAM